MLGAHDNAMSIRRITEEQAALLTEQGCCNLQGYSFSRPLCAEDVEKLLGGA
jgi:EAL domain-containing protein (putative c-di-GMP-specific phosphodiesterase class I)